MNYAKIGQKFSKAKGKIALGATSAYVAVGNAASIDVPLGTQADMEGTVTNGSVVVIAVVIAVVGVGILISMLKKAK